MTEVWRFQPLHHGCHRSKADEQGYQGRSASMLSVVRSVEVPLGISTPGQPNLASTIWRVVSEQQKRVMVDDSVTFPSTSGSRAIN
jgi:choloylglycine hydrolase